MIINIKNATPGDPIGYVHTAKTITGMPVIVKELAHSGDSLYSKIQISCCKSPNPLEYKNRFATLTTTFGTRSDFVAPDEIDLETMRTHPFIYGKGRAGNIPPAEEW